MPGPIAQNVHMNSNVKGVIFFIILQYFIVISTRCDKDETTSSGGISAMKTSVPRIKKDSLASEDLVKLEIQTPRKHNHPVTLLFFYFWLWASKLRKISQLSQGQPSNLGHMV